MKPAFITFTGADDATDIGGMVELASHYPIEWGILFSPKRQGQGRYPSMEFVDRLTAPGIDLRLAAHLCGGYSRSLIDEGSTGLEHLLSSNFDRAQVNTSNPTVDPGSILEWADSLGINPILQCRSSFPKTDSTTVGWLFDASGGRGIQPSAWPEPIPDTLCGYAGGIGPDNAGTVVSAIGKMASRYWIDMEARVRDQHDRFDLERCRAVCEAVYGQGAQP